MKHFFAMLQATLLGCLLFSNHLATAQTPAWQTARTVAAATPSAAGDFSVVKATAADAAGNVYVAGRFSLTVTLGSTTLTSAGGNDVFVAKFNPGSNQFLWAQRAGGTGDDRATALAVNGSQVYVAGAFGSSTATFGATSLANAGLNSSEDVFVAKLIDAGTTAGFAWAQRAGGLENDDATAVAVSGSNVYVAGSFRGTTADFGSTVLTNSAAATSDLNDVFVTKVLDTGSSSRFVWAQGAGGPNRDFASTLAVRGTSVYVAGSFGAPQANFGSFTVANAGGTSSLDIFVAKLEDAGNTASFVWVQQAGGTGVEEAKALAVSGPNVYVTGYFGNTTASFGSTVLSPTTTTPVSGSFDIYVAKLTDAGSTASFMWAVKAGGTSSDEATALVVNGSSLYIAGEFRGPTASFGTNTVTNVNSSTSSSTYDVFVAKLIDAGSAANFTWAQRAGGSESDFSTGIALSGTNIYVAGYLRSATASFGSIGLVNATGYPSGFLASLSDPTIMATHADQPREVAHFFPNPAHSTTTLALSSDAQHLPFVLTDALGKPVRRYTAPAEGRLVLDVSGLPAGVYWLRGAKALERLLIE